MKKFTEKEIQLIKRTDPILVELSKKGKKLIQQERKLRHDAKIKIPREIQKLSRLHDKLTKQYTKRGVELKLWKMEKWVLENMKTWMIFN